MYKEQQQTTEVSDTSFEDRDGDLLINNLIYEMPRSLSLATGRTYVSQFPQRSTYTVDRNNTMIWDWNTGNAFVDTSNSYLKFKIRSSNTGSSGGASFASASALNLFHEYRIRSRSGVELDRLENCNLYNNYRIYYTKSANWINTIGSTFFMNTNNTILNIGNTNMPEICIPLGEVATFFNPLKKGQLLPPQIASGLRIELSLESIQRAFTQYGNPYILSNTVFELFDISMQLDTITMSDDTSKVINLESSMSGLEYSYNRVYNYSATYAAGTSNFTLQVSKAVSQATHAMMITQNASLTQSVSYDSFQSESFNYKNWQFRLGSQYYPNQICTNALTGVIHKGVESYILALSSYEKIKSPFQETTVTSTDFANDLGILAVSLERNQSLQISGLPINNSRLLEVLVERDGSGDGTDKRDVNCFLTYVSVCKAYIDNMAVSI